MQHARRHLIERSVHRPDAKDVGIGNRFGAQPGAEHVANDAADAGGGPAVRIECAGMVVSFDLESDAQLAGHSDHSGIVLKNRDAVVFVAKFAADFLGCSGDEGWEKALDGFFALIVLIIDGGLENLVLAVFGPGLGQTFQFHVGWFPPQPVVIGLDGLHFFEGEGQAAVCADSFQLFAGNLADGNLFADFLRRVNHGSCAYLFIV